MKKYAYLIASLSVLLVFIIFTILVKTVNVELIYNQTYLGFYNLNFKFGNFIVGLGKYDSGKLFSDIVLYVSLGYSAILAIFGAINLIKVKSLKKVNMRYYLLLGAYVVIALVYLLFEIVKVNYSPDSTVGHLKASYPSSHVFIGVTLFLLNSYTMLKLLSPEKSWVIYLTYASAILSSLLLVFTRILSSKHWLTDIIASLLLVGAIYLAFLHFSHQFFPVSDSSEDSNE